MPKIALVNQKMTKFNISATKKNKQKLNKDWMKTILRLNWLEFEFWLGLLKDTKHYFRFTYLFGEYLSRNVLPLKELIKTLILS